jgi:hypothetical protein
MSEERRMESGMVVDYVEVYTNQRRQPREELCHEWSLNHKRGLRGEQA